MKNIELTKKLVRELLDYESETGVLIWKERDVKWFNSTKARDADSTCKIWNTKFYGTEAFTANSHDYKSGAIFGKMYFAHRIIWLYMTGKFPIQVDHINGIRDDNRWVNLREVTNKENGQNQKRGVRNTSGFIGVYWHKRDANWHAKIKVNGKSEHLGTFKKVEDAIAAREAANIKYDFHPNHGR